MKEDKTCQYYSIQGCRYLDTVRGVGIPVFPCENTIEYRCPITEGMLKGELSENEDRPRIHFLVNNPPWQERVYERY